jgi:hypothetical protein
MKPPNAWLSSGGSCYNHALRTPVDAKIPAIDRLSLRSAFVPKPSLMFASFRIFEKVCFRLPVTALQNTLQPSSTSLLTFNFN